MCEFQRFHHNKPVILFVTCVCETAFVFCRTEGLSVASCYWILALSDYSSVSDELCFSLILDLMHLTATASKLRPEILKHMRPIERTTTMFSRLLFFCQRIQEPNDGFRANLPPEVVEQAPLSYRFLSASKLKALAYQAFIKVDGK
jgi:hypothetical protein